MSEKDKTWPAAKEFEKCLYSIRTPSNEKMNELAKLAVKNAKFYKHVVASVEKFIQRKSKGGGHLVGLYSIDAIVKTSRQKLGDDKDPFAMRFARNMETTFGFIAEAANDSREPVIKIVNHWKAKSWFPPDVLITMQHMLDMPVDITAKPAGSSSPEKPPLSPSGSPGAPVASPTHLSAPYTGAASSSAQTLGLLPAAADILGSFDYGDEESAEDRFSEAAKRLEEEKKRLVAFTAASSASNANSGGAIAGPGLPPPMSMGGLAGIPNSLPTLNSAMLAPPAAASQPNPNLGPSNQPVQAAQAQLLSGLLSSFQGTLSGNPNIAAAAQLLQQQLGAVAGAGPPHSAYGAPHPAQSHTGGYPPQQQQQQPAPYGAYGAQQPMYPAQGQAAPGPPYPGSTGPPGAGSGAPMHSGYQQQQQYNRPDSDPQRSSSPGRRSRFGPPSTGGPSAGPDSSSFGGPPPGQHEPAPRHDDRYGNNGPNSFNQGSLKRPRSPSPPSVYRGNSRDTRVAGPSGGAGGPGRGRGAGSRYLTFGFPGFQLCTCQTGAPAGTTRVVSTTLWVGGIPEGSNEQLATELFARFGRVVNVRITPTGSFVKFYRRTDADVAKEKLNFTTAQVGGNSVRLKIGWARPSNLELSVRDTGECFIPVGDLEDVTRALADSDTPLVTEDIEIPSQGYNPPVGGGAPVQGSDVHIGANMRGAPTGPGVSQPLNSGNYGLGAPGVSPLNGGPPDGSAWQRQQGGAGPVVHPYSQPPASQQHPGAATSYAPQSQPYGAVPYSAPPQQHPYAGVSSPQPSAYPSSAAEHRGPSPNQQQQQQQPQPQQQHQQMQPSQRSESDRPRRFGPPVSRDDHRGPPAPSSRRSRSPDRESWRRDPVAAAYMVPTAVAVGAQIQQQQHGQVDRYGRQLPAPSASAGDAAAVTNGTGGAGAGDGANRAVPVGSSIQMME